MSGAAEMRQWHKGQQGSKGNIKEALRQTTVLEVNLAARSSVGIQKMSVKTLWRSRPPLKRKKKLLAA
jgi:hypothetical protein